MTVPTTRKIYLNASGTNTNLRGDTAQLLSRHNHRLYRQGRTYEIRVGLDMDVNGVYEVYALRPDWMVMKAWKKAFETFMNNSKEELAKLGNQKARWQDFRVNALSLTGTNGDLQGTMRGKTSANLDSITTGDFYPSEVRDESGTFYRFSWTDPSSASLFNILEEYEKMGNVSNHPTSVETEAAYSGLDDDTVDGQFQHLADDGNTPPYSATGLENTTPLIKVATIGQVAPGLGVLSTGFFTAPCGLFVVRKISGADLSTNQAEIYVEAKGGSYKGVHSESMGTAKLVKNHYEVR